MNATATKTSKITDKVLNVRLGAMYRFATKIGMARATVETLLAARTALSGKDTKQLAAHWFTTEPLRNQPGTLVSSSPEAARRYVDSILSQDTKGW